MCTWTGHCSKLKDLMTREDPASVSFGPVFTGLSEQIALHGCFRANEIALIEADHAVSWAEYNQAGNRIAQALQAAGVRTGERVALLVSNHIWAHELLLGVWRAGAVAVPLSPLLDHSALTRMLRDASAGILLCSTEYAAKANVAANQFCKLIIEGADFDSWIHGANSAPTAFRSAADDLAVIIYSSGTTGVPKGIAHSHGARLSFAMGFAAEFRFHYRSVALSAIPMHSNGAWLSWSPAMWVGAITLVLPAFTPQSFLELVKQHRPSHGFIVPVMAKALLAHPQIEQAGLDCFETAITAGSPMMEQTKRELCRLTGNGLYELWGLTEGVATIISPQDMLTRPHSVGRPMLGCDIRLIDEQNRDVSFTGVGEIVGYSAGLMSTYWNRPDANAELLWVDDHGHRFIRTGDVGEFDADGYLTLRGRKKDMIISGGMNVYPIDIETLLLQHEAVLDAAVIGIEDEKWGEVPIAFVILKAAGLTDGDALQRWANDKLASHQRLNRVLIRGEDFPRNTLGKVLKSQLQVEFIQPLPASH